MAAPSSVQVLLTNKIKRWIPTVLEQKDLSEYTKSQLRPYSTSGTNQKAENKRLIPFHLVKVLQQCLQNEESSSGCLYLHELLEGSEIVHPTVEVPKRDPELEARIVRLKAQQQNREYRALTKDVDVQQLRRDDFGSIGKEVKTMNRQIIAVFNFILTVIGAFTFGYKATEYSMSEPVVPLQICNGLIVATIVFFADLYFIIKSTV